MYRSRLTSRWTFNRKVRNILSRVLDTPIIEPQPVEPTAHQVTNEPPLVLPCFANVNINNIIENGDCSSSDSESCSDSESGECVPRRSLLRNWALCHQIAHTALRELLIIMRLCGSHHYLPLDPRTLLETPTDIRIHNVAAGEYWHAGIISTVTEHLIKTKNNTSEVEFKFSIDGLPISKSSKGQFWPILCQIKDAEPIVIGIYYGTMVK